MDDMRVDMYVNGLRRIAKIGASWKRAQTSSKNVHHT